MKKKIISLLSALALTAQIVPCALADNDVKVYVNDTEMVTDAPIIIENEDRKSTRLNSSHIL